MCQSVVSRLFRNGSVWSGAPDVPSTDALLVVDGVVTALGADASAQAPADAEIIDLDGGFLMPSFGDGHAHPMYGGLEFVGPAVRPCTSIDEIVEAVRRYAAWLSAVGNLDELEEALITADLGPAWVDRTTSLLLRGIAR